MFIVKASEVINDLMSTTKRTQKEIIIHDAWHNGCEEFFKGAQLAYDSLISFGIKQLPKNISHVQSQTPQEYLKTVDDFFVLCYQLIYRELTGHDARDSVAAFAQSCTKEDWELFFTRVLLKDFKAGVSNTTINKVLEKAQNGDYDPERKLICDDYKIPEFQCQLASDSANHPKHMVGKKYLDFKFDGCLSKFWTVEYDCGKKLTIGEVVDNQVKGKIKSFNTLTSKIEYQEITGFMKNSEINEKVEWFEITLEDGTVLPPLTGNHLVYLPNIKCFRRADQLEINDIVLYD